MIRMENEMLNRSTISSSGFHYMYPLIQSTDGREEIDRKRERKRVFLIQLVRVLNRLQPQTDFIIKSWDATTSLYSQNTAAYSLRFSFYCLAILFFILVKHSFQFFDYFFSFLFRSISCLLLL